MGEKLPVREASRHAGVTTNTIRRWCDTGKLPHTRTAGGDRRIDIDDLDAIINPGTPRKHVDQNPATHIAGWAATSDEWAGWTPDQTTSTTKLEALAIDARAVIRNLQTICDEIGDELDFR